MHISKIVTKCKSKNYDKILYYLDEHGVEYRKNEDESNIFHVAMVPQSLQPYILYENHNPPEHNGFTRLYSFIKRHFYWRKLYQHCNKYVRSCPVCQQVTLKESQYIN